jgi:hypothetical protein
LKLALKTPSIFPFLIAAIGAFAGFIWGGMHAFDPHAELLDVIVLQLVYLILFGLAAGIVGYIVEIVFDWAFKLLKRS